MRLNMVKFVTTVLLLPVTLMAVGTVPVIAQGTPAGPSATQAAPTSPAPARERANAQPAMAPAPLAPARGWAGYRLAQAGSSQPAAKTGQAASAKTSQPQAGWKGYAPAASWSGYRPATARSGSAACTTPARPVNNMDRSRVTGPSPYHGTQPRSYHEYGSGRRVSLAKPWLPGSP
jgi:hypothetical protein